MILVVCDICRRNITDTNQGYVVGIEKIVDTDSFSSIGIVVCKNCLKKTLKDILRVKQEIMNSKKQILRPKTIKEEIEEEEAELGIVEKQKDIDFV